MPVSGGSAAWPPTEPVEAVGVVLASLSPHVLPDPGAGRTKVCVRVCMCMCVYVCSVGGGEG